MIVNKPLVSVIMANYNSEKYIYDSISSVLNQSYNNLELIVIDDNSHDKSKMIITNNFSKDKRVTLIELNKNIGPGLARNKGLEISKGKYITFLDSDDIWSLDKLYIQISLMENLSIPISHTDYGYIKSDGKISSNIFKTSYNQVSFKDLLMRTEISCLTVVYNKEIVGLHFFPSIRRKQDYVVWLNILKKGYNSISIHFVSGYYRQQSSKKVLLRVGYIYSHFKLLRGNLIGLSLYDSLYYTFLYILNGLIRYFKFL